MPPAAEPAWILLPGLGADARLFDDLSGHGPAATTPPWPAPRAGESLRGYAERWAPELARQFAGRELVLAGMSFGGQVALELARLLRPAAVVLLSSHPDPTELTPSFRRQVRLLPWLPDRLLRFGMRRIALPAIARREQLSPAQRARLLAMAADTDLEFFRWASVAAASWTFDADRDRPDCAVHRLHGAHDRIIPLGRREGVDLLDAGHLIPMTHAEEVGNWLCAVSASISS